MIRNLRPGRLMALTLGIFAMIILCGLFGCKKPPVQSKTVTDSTIITKEAIPVILKGSNVSSRLNIDSLKALYAAGTIDRYFTVTDREGLAELEQRIDLLTGKLTGKCTARDTVYIVKYQTKEVYRDAKETLYPAPAKPTGWQFFKKWVNTNLLLFFLLATTALAGMMFFRSLLGARL